MMIRSIKRWWLGLLCGGLTLRLGLPLAAHDANVALTYVLATPRREPCWAPRSCAAVASLWWGGPRPGARHPLQLVWQYHAWPWANIEP